MADLVLLEDVVGAGLVLKDVVGAAGCIRSAWVFSDNTPTD